MCPSLPSFGTFLYSHPYPKAAARSLSTDLEVGGVASFLSNFKYESSSWIQSFLQTEILLSLLSASFAAPFLHRLLSAGLHLCTADSSLWPSLLVLSPGPPGLCSHGNRHAFMLPPVAPDQVFVLCFSSPCLQVCCCLHIGSGAIMVPE